jgi:PAS domain S-box-containing protein
MGNRSNQEIMKDIVLLTGETKSPLLPLAAILFAVAVFVIDTFTPLGIAVAVLYVVVVLMAGRFFLRPGILIVGSACIALTILSYLVQHGETYGPALIRCLVSLAAIAITTFLALRIQSAGTVLREQADLLDITHDAIFVRDMNDIIAFWNRGAEELYGWPREEALGKVSHELIRTVFPAPLQDIKEALIRDNRWEGELVHTKRDGSEVVVASRWSIQRNRAGRPVAILETNNDITERKLAEAKTQRQEKELQLTIDTIPAFVFRILPDGWTDFLNKRWLDYTGLSHSEAEGIGWRAAYHPEDVEQIVETRDKGIASGEPWESEGRIRGADGQYRWFLNRAAPLRDEHGNIVKWYGTNTDIEDRKRAEDALRRSEANLADAQRLSKTGSFTWDVTSGKVRWSDEAYRIFEHDPNVEPTLDLVVARTHPDDHPSLLPVLEGVMRERTQNWELEHRIVMADGTIKNIHVVAHASEAVDKLEYVGALMDVTDTKQAQEALQQAQAELAHITRVTTLGELTASIAHEVNQPLAAVVTNAESSLRWLGRKPPELGEARSAVERIIKDAHRASEVIRRIRHLATYSDPEYAPLDINGAIDETLHLLRRELSLQRVSLRLDLAPGLPPVLGDRVQLQQVVINLVMNGVESMAKVSERPHQLIIKSRQHDAGQIIVAVQDTGVGIDPETADRLFVAFFTTKPGGMGMGLSICRSIIEDHDGKLWASSNDGSGATFQFTVPVHRVSA